MTRPDPSWPLLGYGGRSSRQIDKGIARLSEAVDDALDHHLAVIGALLAGLPPERPPIPTPEDRGVPASAKKQSRLYRAAGKQTKLPPAADIENGSLMSLLNNIYLYPVKGLSGQRSSTSSCARSSLPHDRRSRWRALASDRSRQSEMGQEGPVRDADARGGVGEACRRTSIVETLQFEIRSGNRHHAFGQSQRERRNPPSKNIFTSCSHAAGPPRLMRSKDGHFMDKPDNVISLINLATLRASRSNGAPRSIRCASAPISTSKRASPGKSSIGWEGNPTRRASSSASTARTAAAVRPTSIRCPVCATWTSRVRCARISATKTSASIWPSRRAAIAVSDPLIRARLHQRLRPPLVPKMNASARPTLHLPRLLLHLFRGSWASARGHCTGYNLPATAGKLALPGLWHRQEQASAVCKLIFKQLERSFALKLLSDVQKWHVSGLTASSKVRFAGMIRKLRARRIGKASACRAGKKPCLDQGCRLRGHQRTLDRSTETSASLIGRLGSSTFRLSTIAVSMSLTGSRFSSESAPRPFHHGIRGRGGTIFWTTLPSV